MDINAHDIKTATALKMKTSSVYPREFVCLDLIGKDGVIHVYLRPEQFAAAKKIADIFNASFVTEAAE